MSSLILVVHALPQCRVKRLGMGFFSDFSPGQKKKVRSPPGVRVRRCLKRSAHVVRDDLWVLIMTDDDPYFWHGQGQTAVWRMPPGTRPTWLRMHGGLFFHIETQKVQQSLPGTFRSA